MKLPHKLTTRRLKIRPYRPHDLEAYLAFMLDDEATRYLNLTDEQRTEEGARRLFQLVLVSYSGEEPICALVIACKKTDRFIGSCGLVPLEDGNAECYYTLLPQYQGQGYATEAVRALLDYAFTKLELNEVTAYASEENEASIQVALRLGMKDLGQQPYRESGLTARMFSIARRGRNRQKARRNFS